MEIYKSRIAAAEFSRVTARLLCTWQFLFEEKCSYEGVSRGVFLLMYLL